MALQGINFENANTGITAKKSKVNSLKKYKCFVFSEGLYSFIFWAEARCKVLDYSQAE